MDNKLEKIVAALQKDFDVTSEEFRNEAHVFIQAEQIVAVITALRDTHEFALLSAMTAVDYWPQEEPRFHVIYQLTSIAKNLSIQLRVPVSATRPVVGWAFSYKPTILPGTMRNFVQKAWISANRPAQKPMESLLFLPIRSATDGIW